MQPDPDRIQPVVTKLSLGEQPNDLAYSLAQPPQARIAEVERICAEYHRWKDGAEPRIRKVVRIVQLAHVLAPEDHITRLKSR